MSDSVKKYVRNHILEYLIDMVIMVLFTLMVLYFCEAKELWLGIIFAVAYSLGQTVSDINKYRRNLYKEMK